MKKITNKKKLIILSPIIIVLFSSLFYLNNNSKEKITLENNIISYDNIYNLTKRGFDNIVFLGDYLTEEYPLDTYFEDLPVINSGISTNTTTDILKNMSDLVYQYNPSKVIISIGFNDLKKGKTNDEVYDNILKIVNEIHNNRPKTKIYIESLYPIDHNRKICIQEANCKDNKDIKYINKKLETYFKNSEETYIDVYKYLIDENDSLKSNYTNDGVHLTEDAYVIVSNVIRSAFLENSKESFLNKEASFKENIVFLGDSITHYYPIEAFYSNINVVNSGRQGYKTIDILQELNELVYIYNPTKVFITIGINDLKNNTISRDNTVENIKTIIKEIKENRPKTKIYVESIYPINSSNEEKIQRSAVDTRSQQDIIYINNRLKNELPSLNVEYIDIYSNLLDENKELKIDYTIDGVHLTNKAYVKITSKLLDYITK